MNYSKYLGKRLADFGNKNIYNSANGIVAQCVWYVRCRALEKCGKSTGIYGNANVWYESAKTKGLPVGKVPKTNSIACFNAGKYGHVIFVEFADEDYVYYTEANSNSDNVISPDDGVLKRQKKSDFTGRKGFQGCIYLASQSDYTSMKVTARNGLNYRTSCKVIPATLAGTLSFGSKVSVVTDWSKTSGGYKWRKIRVGKKYFYCVTDWLS